MREIISVVEGRMIPGFKAWYHPTTGESVVLRPFQTHFEKVRDLGDGFASAEEAIKAGWVRLGTHKDSEFRIPESFVHANTTVSAKRAVRWLLDNDPNPGLSFFIETNDGLNWFKLNTSEADLFARTGRVPTRRGSDT